MNIPALISVDYEDEIEGKMAVVDGFTGKLIVNPIEDVLAEYKAKRDEEIEKRKLLQELKGKENITKSGKKINIYAMFTLEGKIDDEKNKD